MYSITRFKLDFKQSEKSDNECKLWGKKIVQAHKQNNKSHDGLRENIDIFRVNMTKKSILFTCFFIILNIIESAPL